MFVRNWLLISFLFLLLPLFDIESLRFSHAMLVSCKISASIRIVSGRIDISVIHPIYL